MVAALLRLRVAQGGEIFRVEFGLARDAGRAVAAVEAGHLGAGGVGGEAIVRWVGGRSLGK